MPSLAATLDAGPVVLDGGLGTLLEALGNDLASDLWSARLLQQSPAAVRGAHREFFAAGARIAIGASYQVSYEGLAEIGLDRSQVDALLVRSVRVEAVVRELDGLGVPAWISVTVADGTLRTGDSLADAAALAASIDEVIAFGVNCCDAAEVSAALAAAAAVGLPGAAYPNSGEHWHAGGRSWSGDPTDVHDRVSEWVGAGARLVGGCCRVGPDQIREIARAVRGSASAGPRSAGAME